MRDKVIAVLRIGAGFLLILVGLFLSLPGIPGPGLLVVVLGLALLSPHFDWARRLMEWGKAKLEQAKERVRGKAQPNPPVGE